MKSGVCPKCASTDVRRREGGPHQAEQVTLSGGLVSRTTAPERYVCGSCGYAELYVSSGEDLRVIRETWERVGS